MRLPKSWEEFLKDSFSIPNFYSKLDEFTKQFNILIPDIDKVFHVFEYMEPQDVKCVLFGEDPYPRIASACGVAFWDKEINSWDDKTNGNSLKNILKALLVANKNALYSDPIAKCRVTASNISFVSPPQLFELWLKQGILLINSAMTFSRSSDKKVHMDFWKNFHQALIEKLNKRSESPFYILWGRKAQFWEQRILESVDDPLKIIKQGHPTFIHQFMDKQNESYSPFIEIVKKTGLKWC